MSIYNILNIGLTCPHCGMQTDFEVNLYFGYRDLISFKVGDGYRWIEGKEVRNGGRPVNGDYVGEGYTECDNCQKDFFVNVNITGDTIISAVVDKDKGGYKS